MDISQLPDTIYNNPNSIQAFILNELQSRITGEDSIVDANNVISFVLEMFSTVTGNAINEVTNGFPSLYPVRALTSEDLFKHMSDFDYVNMFSTPATMQMSLTLSTQYLIDNAVSFNENYKKVIIPQGTIFTVGSYKFGLHYPIEIQINKRTNTFIVIYDTTSINPLNSLSQNTIEHRIFTTNGVEYISIIIPLYQFEKVTVVEDVVSGTGFSKVYSHKDKFYALRAYNEVVVDGVTVFQEVGQTLSDQIYDPKIMVVKLDSEKELNRIRVTVPQVYFTTGKVGSRIKLEIYTCLGSIDSDISNLKSELIYANFVKTGDEEIDKYITILERNPILFLNPLSTKIVGGSNGYDFEELRERVISDTFYGYVLITPDDLSKFFRDAGFIVQKYRDGITDRIYYCFKEITDNADVIIPSASIQTIVNSDMVVGADLTKKVSSIVLNNDGSWTVLPTTIYKYNSTNKQCVPLVDSEVAYLTGLNKPNKVSAFNTYTYTKCPYHLRIDTSARYNAAFSYDLTTPEITVIEFLKENINVSTQMSVYNASIVHLDNGAGGYRLQLRVFKSADLTEVDVNNLVVYVETYVDSGVRVWTTAEYVTTDGEFLIYNININTSYYITKDHRFYVGSFRDDAGNLGGLFNLSMDLKVIFMVSNTIVTSATAMDTDLVYGLPADFSEYVPLASQKVTTKFGSLVKDIHNQFNLLYEDVPYQQYEEDVYATYLSDIYETDDNGVPVYTVNGSSITLNKLHSKGDTILDGEGNPIVLHSAGDIILDVTGQPVPQAERKTFFLIHMLHIDAKYIWSENHIHSNYMLDVCNLLNSYYKTVGTARSQLIENTKLFFKPIRTLGTASFKLNESTYMELPLEMSIKFRFHVYPFVLEDEYIKNLIRESTIKIIDKNVSAGIISCTAIAEQIRSEMSDNILFVDVLGLYDTATLSYYGITLPSYEIQTLVLTDTSIRPSLRQRLVYEQNNTIDVERALTIEFVAMDI